MRLFGIMQKRLVCRNSILRDYFRIGRDIRIFIIFLGALLNQPYLVLVLLALLMNIENIRRMVVLYKYG